MHKDKTRHIAPKLMILSALGVMAGGATLAPERAQAAGPAGGPSGPISASGAPKSPAPPAVQTPVIPHAPMNAGPQGSPANGIGITISGDAVDTQNTVMSPSLNAGPLPVGEAK
jgi:hypothetical protein